MVSSVDPASHSEGDALFCSANQSKPTRFDVSPGIAVFRDGSVREYTAGVFSQALAVPSVDIDHVVFAEYFTVDSTDRALTATGASVAVRQVYPADAQAIRSVTLTDWNAFDEERLSRCVPLAVCRLSVGSDGTTALTIDSGRKVYAWNRPWFSVEDGKHRSLIGSGTPTVNNPHGIALADLSVGEMSLLRMLNFGAGIISKDVDVPNVPGILCKETVTPNRILSDETGSITGHIDALYVKLEDIPVHLGRCYSANNASPPNRLDLPVSSIAGTNILILHATPPANFNLLVYYTRAAGLKPIHSAPDILDVEQLDSEREICVSGGITVPALPETIDLRKYRPFPMVLRAFVDRTGSGFALPQPVVCHTSLEGVGATSQSLSAVTLYGPSYIAVTLTGANSGNDLNVTLALTLIDKLGATVTRSVVFNQNWRDALAPDAVKALNKETAGTYQTLVIETIAYDVVSWQITARQNDGPQSAIGIFAYPVMSLNQDLQELCCLGHVLWDGLRIKGVRDRRRVSHRFSRRERISLPQLAASLALGGVGASRKTTNSSVDIFESHPSSEVWVEDFEDPRYHGLFLDRQFDAGVNLLRWTIPNTALLRADFELEPDRWAEGLGDYNPDYPSTDQAQPVYISRAIPGPRMGHGDPYSGEVTLRIVRTPDEIGLLPEANNSGLHATTGRTAKVYFRFIDTSSEGAWSSWLELGPFNPIVRTADEDTWIVQTSSPSTVFFTAFQIAVQGGQARAVAAVFRRAQNAAGVGYDEFSFEVNGEDPAALDENGNLPITVIRSNPRFEITLCRHMGAANTNWLVYDEVAPGVIYSGVYALHFRYNDEKLDPNEYLIEVTPSKGRFRSSAASTMANKHAFRYNKSDGTPAENGWSANVQDTPVAIHFYSTIVAHSSNHSDNRRRFQVSIKVPNN